ncbi:MAG: glycosyltransferase family 9 protein [Acidiferrobacter sp.]
MKGAPRVLIIRRDNIGDLVCTTPLFSALRRKFPDGYLALLTNSYSAPIVMRNPDLDAIYVYAKGKHLPWRARPAAYIRRIKTVLDLRHRHFDFVILAAASYYVRGIQFSRWVRGTTTIGFSGDHGEHDGLDIAIARPATTVHEVEDLFQLLAPLGIGGAPPPLTVVPDPAATAQARETLHDELGRPLIGVHISAREQENRWPKERFQRLLREGTKVGFRFALFWSPGPNLQGGHPGDDDLAAAIMREAQDLPIIAYRTAGLPELAAGLAACRCLIACDGGHCHVAAAVGTPVLGLYCDYKVVQWRPWGSGHRVLSGRRVEDIAPDAVLEELRTMIDP